MTKLGLALFLALLGFAPAQAQNAGWPPPAGTVAFLGVYNSTPATLTNTQVGFAQLDASGYLKVNVAAGAAAGCTGTTGTPCVTNVQNWGAGSGVLGAIANYGTSPGAVLVPGVNAFITNTPTVSLSAETTKVIGTVNQGTSPWVISGAVTIAAAPLQPLGITPTDRTVTSATGSSQTVMSANASRHSLIIQNTGSANCGVNPTGGTAVIGGAGTLTLVPQGSYQPRVPTLAAVTAICTAAQPLYAEEN